jgi:hypothetical protein
MTFRGRRAERSPEAQNRSGDELTGSQTNFGLFRETVTINNVS